MSTEKIVRDSSTRYLRTRREEGVSRGAFDTEIRRLGGTPRVETDVERASAPENVAEILGIEAGAETAARKRRMFSDDRLVQLADSYIPVDVAEAAGIEQPDPGKGGIISRMADAGFEQTEVTEEIQQHPASDAEAAALGVDAGALLLRIIHVGRTAEGRAVEVTVHTLAPNAWVLRYSVPTN
ncbi:UTRA domain-containing protein [Streptomyces rubiginosohelvolus]|uniref:GntR family transcriptional regulator n=1 Tax=Streptomyces rubiginosohelvolus TaxID=67362 RepID=A0ABQ3CBW0_9ACTN|nr:UTRA domain-containing protein [Streptomyces pluricolorescens]GGZ84248.1 GntR family transcriptional regulator [Streptomyces pluricolorescens]